MGANRPAMGPRSRIAWVLAAAVLAIAALSAYWVWYAAQIEAGIARWAEERRQGGYQVTFGGPTIDGFPLSHVTRLGAPAVAAPSGWRWQGPPLTGRMKIWDPQTIAVSFAGLHRLERLEAGRLTDAEIESERAQAVVRVRADGRLDSADAQLNGLELRGNPLGRYSASSLRLRLVPVYPAQPGQAVHLTFSSEVRDLRLPPAVAGPLDQQAERLHLEGRLEGAVQDVEPRLALSLWRDAGGALVVDRLELSWDPLDLQANGRMTLDSELRPLGDLNARIAGLPELFDRLAARGLMPPDQVSAMKLAVLALARERDSEGRDVVELPVSFRGGYLFLGPLRLAPVSPVL